MICRRNESFAYYTGKVKEQKVVKLIHKDRLQLVGNKAFMQHSVLLSVEDSISSKCLILVGKTPVKLSSDTKFS
ncbi:hypothetical protein V6N13_084652 [Hibiscus sabdariffa]